MFRLSEWQFATPVSDWYLPGIGIALIFAIFMNIGIMGFFKKKGIFILFLWCVLFSISSCLSLFLVVAPAVDKETLGMSKDLQKWSEETYDITLSDDAARTLVKTIQNPKLGGNPQSSNVVTVPADLDDKRISVKLVPSNNGWILQKMYVSFMSF